MRRCTILLLALLLVLALPVTALGASQVTNAGYYANVAADGSCQVTLTLTLQLDQAGNDLTFPLPMEASNVTVNGRRVWTQKNSTNRTIDLADAIGNAAGVFTVTVQYRVDKLLAETPTGLQLQLPLLSGFAYAIAAIDFSVTLPGPVTTKPMFSSGYHGVNIEKELQVQVKETVISGKATGALKDRETLLLMLPVEASMFPQAGRVEVDLDFLNGAMTVTTVLAALYWLLFLRGLALRRLRRSTPPEGYGAGELGSVLTLQGADLTMMAFSWAQLGYITIQAGHGSRVLLHKRMDMGNERSSFEQHWFHKLFGKRHSVDCSGYQYIQCGQKMARQTSNLQPLLHPRSGNFQVFRALASLTGLFGGAALGMALSEEAALQWFLIVVTAALGGISSWLIQSGVGQWQLRQQGKVLTQLCCCGLWLIFGLASGLWAIALTVLVVELLAGLMTFYGGRRTEDGRQAAAQTLGLRQYLRTVSKEELQRISQDNPEYFFDLAPCALALGVDAVFARSFGKARLPECPYLHTSSNEAMDAAQWSDRMRQIVQQMDSRLRPSRIERLRKILAGLLNASGKPKKK